MVVERESLKFLQFIDAGNQGIEDGLKSDVFSIEDNLKCRKCSTVGWDEQLKVLQKIDIFSLVIDNYR